MEMLRPRWEPRLWALLALALIPSGARGRQCKAPEIENGRVDFIDLQFGATANFSCDEGYRLIGPTFAQCVIVGNVSDWNAKVPHCQVTCVSPELENGRTNGSLAPYSPGDVAALQCKPGYTLRGSSETRCQNDGRWDPPVPICERVGCGVPTRLSFAELKSDYRNQSYFPVGKTANYTCRPGYSKHPAIRPTITCLPNGRWSEPLEFCERKSCGHPGELENGRINHVTDMLFGSMVNFTCEEGHRLIGESYRRCEISDSHVAWSGVMPYCERIPCYPPPDIPNGKHSGVLVDDFSYGSAVTYTCDNGYPPTGEASILCTTEDGLNGVWRPAVPRCGEVSCPAPQIENGRREPGQRPVYSYKDSVTFECDPGYTMKGHRVSQCQTDQTWAPPVPVCERVSEVLCMAPEIQHGRQVGGRGPLYRPRDRVTFECDPGYNLDGSRQIECRDDTTWRPPVPVCIQPDKSLMCPPPPVIHHGNHDANFLAAFPSGTYVNYSCEPSFTLRGKASIYCTTSGTWSHPCPLCEGDWNIFKVLGIIGLLLLPVIVFVIWKIISKQKTGSYYTCANKNETTLIPMTAENT